LKYLTSISAVEKDDLIGTNGSEPFYVLCDDLNTYVCKYHRHFNSPAISLFNEYISACFLKEWGLKVPDFAFIKWGI
jgi:hypothetical protein